MIEKTKEAIGDVSAVEERAAWCRPTLRRVEASEAQGTLANNNADIVFS